MIEKALSRLAPEERAALNDELGLQSIRDRYQTVMRFLVNSYGQDALNELVRESVLEARTNPSERIAIDQIDRDIDGWNLPAAVEAAGKLIAQTPELSQRPILTTNFDPLLEISIRRAGSDIRAIAIFLSSDGRFDNVQAPTTAQIVHLHDGWSGSDTLHTPSQLQSVRPQLVSCLRDLLRDTTLVVMGYGGWNDVFTKTLFDLLAEHTSSLNVLWCFHAADDAEILSSHTELFERSSGAAGSRLAFYKGIDCHSFLPELLADLGPSRVPLPLPMDETNFSERVASLDACDYPPSTTTWVGRSDELTTLTLKQAKVLRPQQRVR